MADALKLPVADREALAGKLSSRIASSSLAAGVRGDLELGEVLEVHILRTDALAGRPRIRRLSGRTEPAPYVHLQIREQYEPIFAAHATMREDGWSVRNLFGSDLAPRIGSAIAWVDRHLPEPGNVRLLLVPEAHAVAFWIEQAKRDRVVPISGSSHKGRKMSMRSRSVNLFLTLLFGDYANPVPVLDENGLFRETIRR